MGRAPERRTYCHAFLLPAALALTRLMPRASVLGRAPGRVAVGAQLGGYLPMCALATTGLPAPTQIALALLLALDLAENFLLLQTDLFGNQIGSNFFSRT